VHKAGLSPTGGPCFLEGGQEGRGGLDEIGRCREAEKQNGSQGGGGWLVGW
jgi:hypothetical protein